MRTMSMRTAIAIISVSVVTIMTCLTAGPVLAVPTLDQAFIPDESPTMSSGIGGTDKAQTFTVGIEGTLTRVDAYIYGYRNSVPLRFDIRSTIGGIPVNDDKNVLASQTFADIDIPTDLGFFSFDISSFGIYVKPGEIYALVLMGGIGNRNTGYSWLGDHLGSPGITEDPYALGHSFFRNPEYPQFTNWSLMADIDQGFRTFVEPARVPEPATMLLFGAGLAGLGIMRKRFKA